jgi:hypothetical protein
LGTGGSVRDAGLARRATDVFLTLAAAIGQAGIPATVSLDLSHIGSVVDRDLGLRHAREIAGATAPLGTAMTISAEGSDRADLVLDLYEALIFGGEWWLYALNRIAEQPERVLAALADMNHLIVPHA